MAGDMNWRMFIKSVEMNRLCPGPILLVCSECPNVSDGSIYTVMHFISL